MTKWSKEKRRKNENKQKATMKNNCCERKAQKRKIEYLECFICKKRMNSMRVYNLKRHISLHSYDWSRLKCLACGRSYSNYGNFVKHLPRRHKNRNPDEIKYEPTKDGFQPRQLYFYS